MSLIDPLGRRFRSLRISLTAACNYACDYCVPPGSTLKPSASALSGTDLVTLARLLDRVLDIRKIRLTGGEPLIAPNLTEALVGLSDLTAELSLTTNGQFLARHVPALKAAGCKRINLSLDALDPVVFRRMAKAGDVDSVIEGALAARDAGLQVKVNMVPMRGKNLDQVASLFQWCADQGFQLRFIELMKMGHLHANEDFDAVFVGREELIECLSEHGPASRVGRDSYSTSEVWRNEVGEFGFIANESAPFCGDCDRLRLTSEGLLFGCISSSNAHDIRPALAMDEAEAVGFLVNTLGKALKDKQPVRFSGEQTIMQILGG